MREGLPLGKTSLGWGSLNETLEDITTLCFRRSQVPSRLSTSLSSHQAPITATSKQVYVS